MGTVQRVVRLRFTQMDGVNSHMTRFSHLQRLDVCLLVRWLHTGGPKKYATITNHIINRIYKLSVRLDFSSFSSI